MTRKQAVNWAAIKKRYLTGEKPKDIGPDYGLTAEQVTQKAKRDKWKPEKDTIEQKVVEIVASEIDRQLAKIGAIFEFQIDNIARDIQSRGAYVTSDEKLPPDPFHEITYSKGLASYLDKHKQPKSLEPLQMNLNINPGLDPADMTKQQRDALIEQIAKGHAPRKGS